MITFLFTKNATITSKCIRSLYRCQSSHFAIGFDVTSRKGVVFHSNIKGVHLMWASHFLRKNTVVHALAPVDEVSLTAEEAMYQAIINNFDGLEGYDLKAFSWLAVAGLKYRLTGQMPEGESPYQSESGLLCTEVAERLAPIINSQLGTAIPLKSGLLLPDTLYGIMKASLRLHHVRSF